MLTEISLPNGFRIIAESIPHVRSVTISVWLYRGSRHESEAENGLTHFAEHLLFKGTPTRHWKDIAREINTLGGHFNASTSTDWVKVYCHVVEDDLEPAVRLIADMFLNSNFPESEVNRERQVILEEIAMYDDIPEDLCAEKFTTALLHPHPLSRPVIGTADGVSDFSRDELANYWQRNLRAPGMILSIAGQFDQQKVTALAQELFSELPNTPPDLPGMDTPVGAAGRAFIDRDLEQINFCIGTTGPTRTDESRYAWMFYDTILGGGMGSRLFDEVREKRGLAYSIGSAVQTMYAAGYLSISGSTRPEHAKTAVSICREEVQRFAADGATDEEMETARKQLRRTCLLGWESLGMHASLNGERALYGMEQIGVEEVIRRLDAVSLEDVNRIAQQVDAFGEPAICCVGPLKKAKGLVK